MRLPTSLQTDRDDLALDALRRYYGTGSKYSPTTFTGARFDDWDSSGTRSVHRDRFTADDLVAVSLLSVSVPAAAAIELLDTRSDHFSQRLVQLGDDRDLVDEREPWRDEWEGWLLWNDLVGLPGVGATTASKLLARKRPRLRPIYDSVVAEVIGSTSIWEPMRVLLTTTPQVHERLLRLRHDAGLPATVSPLRVFDVVTWMEGKAQLDGRPDPQPRRID